VQPGGVKISMLWGGALLSGQSLASRRGSSVYRSVRRTSLSSLRGWM
jgi:hypothetical protein